MAREPATDSTVREVVVEWPQTREVLERFGIDYCCGGGKSLGAAAAEAGVDAESLRRGLQEAMDSAPAGGEGAARNWAEATLTELADHIERRHHAFMKEQLPRLDRLFGRVLQVHGEAHGDVLEPLRTTFDALSEEIEMHLMKEEQVLFPFIRSMEAHAEGRGPRAVIHCITVRNPVSQMEREHENAGSALAKMRELTTGYSLPDDACESFRALYDGLQALERDLHEHIHLENNILFPRAVGIEMEATPSASRG
jgi:regulator of cell morphogenesis and NO signaling